ncbi:MAG: 23S rRNA (uracil(1939)-C(5))-methyltransferase RlmD, partial [Lachnospiraceae bacterium]|nr:23S rRNA (uracil(1939)-C(5))-methyltransferase RlmD [Lachnospiraceae bacterium]
MEYTKNQVIETYIEDMSDNGEGIGRISGYTLFIKDAVIGDRIKAKITKVKKKYGYGRVMEILEPSPDRVRPLCDIADKCGGCTLQVMSYEAQLRYKEKKVRGNLVRIGGFPEDFVEEKLEPIIGAENPFRYRNKAQFPVGYDRKQNIISGFYISRSHEIVSNCDCYLGVSDNKIITDILLRHFEEHKIEPYDESTGKGLIRHIMIRKGFVTGEIMVCLIINYEKGRKGILKRAERETEVFRPVKSGEGSEINVSPALGTSGSAEGISEISGEAPYYSREVKQESSRVKFIQAQDELIDKLIRVEGIKSICVNINNEMTNVIMGEETYTIWGSDTIRDTLMGLTFEISPASFFQVNPVQTEKLYSLISEFACLSGKEEVWDICCGIGTITLMLSKKAGKVHGIEIVPDAIENAKKNARINNIENADFICAPAEEFLPIIKGKMKADLVVMDPPRKGMDIKSLDAIIEAKPERMIYVSCDSATLARDLKYLYENGYEPVRIRPVDMFP